MEDWQREHITKNLPELASNTIFNGDIQAELRAKYVLGKADLEKLNAEINQNGNSKASYLCYEWLMGRLTAYKVLTQALFQSNQTGAARLLIAGVPKNVSDKPLTYLGIPVNLKGFKDMEIEVYGKKLKIHEFLPTTNYENLQQIFQETVGELEIYDTFFIKQRTFVLATNTVPPKPTYYVPRFLSNRIKIDESIFKAEGSDVFVFKNIIPRYKISQIARPHFTADSTSQLTNITSRFIYLDENEDWSELKKISKVPIHLIHYETASAESSDDESDPENTSEYKEKPQDQFILDDTSATGEILRKLGSKEERVYLSEEEFVEQQLSENCTSSSVCICDTPGMGKTFLLGNIARLIADICTLRIVVFIQLTSFVQTCFVPSSKTKVEPETILINVLSYICPHGQNPDLLPKLVKAKLVQLQIFFDGFDEIPTDKVEWTKQIFRCITKNFPQIRIYITSRPDRRKALEQSLNVVAYDILPFNHQNQVDFLVQYWQKGKPDLDYRSLESYAISCLDAVNESLTSDEKEIAGIPLLCRLIAEIYLDKFTLRSIKTGKLYDAQQKFIEKKTKLVAMDKNEFDNIKIIHIWHALKLLFPWHDFHEDQQFKTLNDFLTTILRVGILQKHSHGDLEFIHRTFAEYFAAHFFFSKLKEMQQSEKEKSDSIAILKLLLNCQKTKKFYKIKHRYNFVYFVMVSFFNSALVNDQILEELQTKGAGFVSSISHEDFVSILCACCQHNLFNIFCLLTQPLTTWDKSRILEIFTEDNSYALLSVCITESISQLFQKCIQLLAETLNLDLEQINTVNKDYTLLRMAVKCANYEAVEYFVERISLQNQFVLHECIGDSYRKDDVEKRVNILHLLLSKDPSLIHETQNILLTFGTIVRLFKILVQYGVNLSAADKEFNNCAMRAAEYMSSTDFHELVQFLLTDCKAEYLFLENEKWKDPLPYIIEWGTLLQETLELLLNIPGIDINMKDKYGENLLFCAVRRNKLDILQQLVNRGLDYIARGMESRSLLHAAAKSEGVEMLRYLLSLKLDVTSQDQNALTPLHYAAEYKRLSKMKVLVENGANVQANNNKGQTALHFSAQKEYPDKKAIKYLIGKGVGVNDRDNNGNTPLHLCWNKEAIDCLIELGADIHAKNEKGQTPAQKNPWLWKGSSSNSDTGDETDSDWRML